MGDTISGIFMYIFSYNKTNPHSRNARLNSFEVCQCNQRKACRYHCNIGMSTDISAELNYQWETVWSPKNCFCSSLQLSLSLNDLFLFQNPHCQSNGMRIQISSTVQFPNFTITADWLNGSFKLKEMHMDLENIFVIYENAFAGKVFERMQKLVFNNLHLPTMDTMLIRK